MTDVLERLSPWRDRIDAALAAALKNSRDRDGTPAPARLVEAMAHGVLGGGKRLRPLLVLASAQAAGGNDDDAMPSAIAVEYVHSYSLIHDDLPALDNDDLRRGRPTVHRAFDHATAVLAGDALLTDAFAILSSSSKNTAAQVRELALAVGSAGMVGGQYDDIHTPNATETALGAIHRRKTGRLFSAATALGALAAGREEVDEFRRYGAALGLAFQLRDDVLDAQGYATLLGADEAGRRARAAADDAARIARALGAPLLEELAAFSADRGH